MKTFIITSMVFLLSAVPAFAAICDDGYHYEENISYEDGACLNEVTTHTGTINPRINNGLVCWILGGDWFGGACYYGGAEVTECTEYEQVEVDNGSCVEDDVIIPEPEAITGCTKKSAANYNPDASVDDHSCYNIGSNMIIPTVGDATVTGGIGGATLSFLTNQFMTCRLVANRDQADFAVMTDGTPTRNGWSMVGSADSSYEISTQEDELMTSHQIGVPLERGDWFIRPICSYFGRDIYGKEITTNIQ